MAAFAAAFAVSEKNKKAEAVRESRTSVTRQERKLDSAIASANARYERAEAEKRAAGERVQNLSDKMPKSERKATRKTYMKAEAETERTRSELNTLTAAKEATEKSKVLSREEKAEMLALVMAVNADRKNAKAAERLVCIPFS